MKHLNIYLTWPKQPGHTRVMQPFGGSYVSGVAADAVYRAVEWCEVARDLTSEYSSTVSPLDGRWCCVVAYKLREDGNYDNPVYGTLDAYCTKPEDVEFWDAHFRNLDTAAIGGEVLGVPA